MKIICILLCIVGHNAFAKEVVISKIKLNSGNKVEASLKLNDLNTPYAEIAIKTDRKGSGGCLGKSSTLSTNRCRVTIERVIIEGLTINDKNEIIYSYDKDQFVCGNVLQSPFGSKAILNQSCSLQVARDSNHFAVTRLIVN